MKRNIIILLLICSLSFILCSCKEEEPETYNELMTDALLKNTSLSENELNEIRDYVFSKEAVIYDGIDKVIKYDSPVVDDKKEIVKNEFTNHIGYLFNKEDNLSVFHDIAFFRYSLNKNEDAFLKSILTHYVPYPVTRNDDGSYIVTINIDYSTFQSITTKYSGYTPVTSPITKDAIISLILYCDNENHPNRIDVKVDNTNTEINHYNVLSDDISLETNISMYFEKVY